MELDSLEIGKVCEEEGSQGHEEVDVIVHLALLELTQMEERSQLEYTLVFGKDDIKILAALNSFFLKLTNSLGKKSPTHSYECEDHHHVRLEVVKEEAN